MPPPRRRRRPHAHPHVRSHSHSRSRSQLTHHLHTPRPSQPNHPTQSPNPLDIELLADVQALEDKAEDALAAARRVVEIAKFLVLLPDAIKALAAEEKEGVLRDVQGLKDMMKDMQECIAKFGKKGATPARTRGGSHALDDSLPTRPAIHRSRRLFQEAAQDEQTRSDPQIDRF